MSAKRNTRALIVLGLVVLLSVVVVSGYWIVRYFGLSQPTLESGEVVKVVGDVDSPTPLPTALATQIVATNLDVPWSVVFTSIERMLVSERAGRIREVVSGTLSEKPVFVFEEVSETGEEGLMGLAVYPDYAQSKNIAACLAYPGGEELLVKVVKLVDGPERLELVSTLIDQIPGARFHAGCRLGFGPDGMLYITTGDALDKNLAQDQQSLAGKVLRIEQDGSIPEDNPWPNSPVYSLGHRNSQGITWTDSGVLLSTEHGPSLFDGPAGGDEINRIQSGQNFGWPLVSHEQSQPGLVDPLLVFTPAVAPASALFYTGDVYPALKNSLLFGGLKGEGVYQVRFDNNYQKVSSYQKLEGIELGRIRDLVQGPDGFVYGTTSNTDGRGSSRDGDDKIFKIVVVDE